MLSRCSLLLCYICSQNLGTRNSQKAPGGDPDNSGALGRSQGHIS